MQSSFNSAVKKISERSAILDLGVGLCAALLPVMAILNLLFRNENLEILLYAALPVAILAAILLIFKVKDVFSPVFMFFLIVLLSSFIKAASFIYLDDDGASKLRLLNGNSQEILISGAVLILIGTLGFLIGYAVNRLHVNTDVAKKYVRKSFSISVKRMRLVSVITIAISIFAFVLYADATDLLASLRNGIISTKRIHESTVGIAPRGSSLGLIKMFGQNLPQVVFLIYLSFLSGNVKIKLTDVLLTTALFGVSSLIPFFGSARTELVYVLLIAVMVVHYRRRAVSPKVLALFAIITLIGLAFMAQLRVASRDIDNVNQASLSESAVDNILNRGYFMDIGKTSVIATNVPEKIDYIYGKSLFLFWAAPIPRTLWPEKPIVRIGPFVWNEVYGNTSPNGTASPNGIPPGFIGELYLNFGRIGVLIGMIAAGFVFSASYVGVKAQVSNVRKAVYYSITATVFIFGLFSGDFTLFLSQLARYLLLAIIVFRITRDVTDYGDPAMSVKHQ